MNSDVLLARRPAMPSAVTVVGGRELSGDIRVPGFKHALVTIVAAAGVGRAPVLVRNCPDVEDTRVLAELLRHGGARVRHDADSLAVDADQMHTPDLDARLVGRIHGAVYLLPGLLTRFGRARIPPTGGCAIGDGPVSSRPVHHYADVLRRFGATVSVSPDGALDARASRLHGCEIDLRDYAADRFLRTGPLYSGGTKMAVLAAAAAHGVTRLLHPYPKPDVTELVDVLAGMGADIHYLSPDELLIHGNGPDQLCTPVEHVLVADLIEVVTWVTAAVATGSSLGLLGVQHDRVAAGLASELAVWHDMGLSTGFGHADTMSLAADPPRRGVAVTVASHGVFSDSQPFLTLLSTMAPGPSSFRDTVWRNRFSYVDCLNSMGTRIDIRGDTAWVAGGHPPRRAGSALVARDLRAAATLLLAALSVPATTRLSGVAHLGRGYTDLIGGLISLGAEIHVNDPAERGGRGR